MGKAIPYDYRVKIVERMKMGEKASVLSEELGYSEGGIKKIWYTYKKEGALAYQTKYANCGRNTIYPASIREAVEGVRDNMQGAGYVHSKLKQRNPERCIPSERTLQRWWVTQGSNRKKGRPADVEKKVEPKGP